MSDCDRNDRHPENTERLRAALSRLSACRVVVPQPVDEAICRAAREHLAGDEAAQAGIREAAAQISKPALSPIPQSAELAEAWQPREKSWITPLGDQLQKLFGRWRFAAWGGVAVAIIAVGVLVWLGGHPRLAARPEDLNGDGVVDMLDAFALARELRDDPASHPQFDFNGDGVLDQQDVQALAARAVRLEDGGRS